MMKFKFNKSCIATVCFLVFVVFCKAQPGGGGGLSFGKLFDENFKPIDLGTPGLSIRNFVLSGNGVNEELYDIRPLYLIPSKWNYYSEREVACSNQRLLIQYMGAIMIIDLLNILQENGMGNSDHMDSLVFMQGHFTVITNTYGAERNDNRQKLEAILSNGITPFSALALKESGWIKYNSNTDVSFLNEDKLTAHFILKRGVQSFKKEKYDAAITDIYTAIRKGLSTAGREEALSTLANCYSRKGEFEKSVELLTELINSRSVNDNYRLMNCYKARIDAYTALKKYEKALEDYDYIIRNTLENQNVFIAEKAQYKQKYLSDCVSSISDFQKLIDAIPGDHLRDRPGGWSEYADSYFAFGSLEFSCKHFSEAFNQWLKAMEFGYAQTSAPYAVAFFDSIIRIFPGEPKLYLSRAIANYKRAPYLGWGDETKNVLRESVLDTERAEELGMNDFRIYLYRAQSLNLLKMNDDALTEINIAIKKNKDDPRAYAVRYRILTDLGKTVWGKDHEDLVKYRELSKQFNFKEN